eukprot:380212-Prymnesium_polylepis.2
METQVTLDNDAALLFIHGHFHSRGAWYPCYPNAYAPGTPLKAVITRCDSEKLCPCDFGWHAD